ncbi:TIGR00159 family protein [bacterium]|nr:TIGR00159 family protein [Candidatus Brocadiia bacterium]NQT52812.1 TIGR00159 family protein [bacterium]
MEQFAYLLNWRTLSEIAVLAVFFYMVLRFLRGSRGARILKGLGVVGVVLLFGVLFLARHLELHVIQTVATGALSVLGFALLVIFQPELRRALVRLGQSRLVSMLPHARRGATSQILDAVQTLSREKVGALIAIQREVGLRSYAEGGVRLDAEVSAALLVTIFHPDTPLHDGAVIISGERIVAAGCLFPLTENVDVSSGLGTRHRAAIGVTEDSDAITIVVSEETGAVSFALKGQITRHVEATELGMFLRSLYTPEQT